MVARLAVDGNTDGDYYQSSCTHTSQWIANPSWWVDLGRSYNIGRVVIFNRQDCCPERINPFNIHIGNSDQVALNPKCGGDHQIALNQPSISVSCQGMAGRYVGVRLPGNSRTMTLCEVQVFAGRLLFQIVYVNIARGKTAYQTSTRSGGGSASRAVDGNTNGQFNGGSCTHTWGPGSYNPTWWVDLGQTYQVNRVVIYNRLDCCRDRLSPFHIHIGDSAHVTANPRCGGDHRISTREKFVSIRCPGMTGRYVGIRLQGYRILTMCEVQVFSNAEETCQVGNGASYRGTLAVTETGRTCQRWDRQSPHSHNRTPRNYPAGDLAGNNYCRNPDGWQALWCYTTDPASRWEHCDLPVCG
ncbi:PREDICTED: hepatocyte growth factor activator-like [Branchiostoma belcheri]|uniref:Hepatocyte growth factor activator-like n=1 Tax=Branchiostoma belcheri TaxID=7741 RepID=A0A6P4YU93_BRABE|nr:PREDICTED: hepatocyte growth factor activator-like [Branchiostoma belcheri]